MEQKWYKPSQIAKEGLILSPSGKPNYRYVLRLIKLGKLKAKEWTRQGDKPYFMVHIDEIKRFNESFDE